MSPRSARKKQPRSLTWVCDANNEQLAEHVCHHLHGGLTDHVTTDQVYRRGEKSRASARRLHPDFLVLAVEEVVGAVAHKLGEGVP